MLVPGDTMDITGASQRSWVVVPTVHTLVAYVPVWRLSQYRAIPGHMPG